MKSEKTPSFRPGLGKEIKLRHFFVLGFGCIVGVGWVIVLGEWLKQAGPLGALIGFAGGGSLMLIVGLCYAEMSTMFPVAGGEIAYTYEIFGVKASFLSGWLLVLNFTAFISFEAISAGWVMETLLPCFKGTRLYTIRGEPVNLGGLLLALVGTLFLAFLNYRGIKSAVIFQEIFTYGLILFSLIFIFAGIFWGKLSHLQPLFSRHEFLPLLGGVVAVFVTAPIFLAGFNVIPQVMEEKAEGTPTRLVGRVIILSLLGALFFYLLVILSSSMSMPWKKIINFELPAAAAFEAAFHSPLIAKIVLFAALCGIVTTWNTVFIAASRALFSLGRGRIIPSIFGIVHPRFGSPFIAVFFSGAVAFLGIFLGRKAIIPIVNVGATCVTFAYFLVCLGIIKMRRLHPQKPRPYRMPGGAFVAAIGGGISLLTFFLTLYQPYANSKGEFPLEWAFLLGWLALGAIFWSLAHKIRTQITERERRLLILGKACPPGLKEEREEDS